MSARATVAAPVQLDLLAVLEEAKQDLPAPCLYGSQARGLAARLAEFEAWMAEHGNFGCFGRSHAWHLSITHPSEPAGRCQPAVLTADVRKPHWADGRQEPPCDCTSIDELLRRGACRGCDWEGPPRGAPRSEYTAAEDACDHAWPGWRDLPLVPHVPEMNGPRDKYAKDRWIAHVTELYPAGWLTGGGPIRTLRTGYGIRHIPSATPFGGYDMGVPEVLQ